MEFVEYNNISQIAKAYALCTVDFAARHCDMVLDFSY